MQQAKLSLAIALLCSASGAVALEETQQGSATTVERIAITGSRLKQVDMEGASPVTVIDAQSIIAAGFNNVGDALRASNFNSFGSWGGGANNSWASQSTVSMKGSGSERTLVLLDGQRMAKSPVMDGGSANLNTLPMAAVERIEVLSDGASAIYGTDAMAGVINIILKKDYNGSQLNVRRETTSRSGGGDSYDFSMTTGFSDNNSNFIMTWEHKQRDAINMRSRAYEAPYVVAGGDPGLMDDWRKIWEWGRTIVKSSDGSWAYQTPLMNDDCSVYNKDGKNAFIGPVSSLDYPDDRACLYDHSVAANMTSSSNQDNILAIYNRELTPDIKLHARTYWATNRSKDVSAPVPGTIIFPHALPSYTTAAGHTLRAVDEGDRIYYRFDSAGDRVAKHNDNILDFLVSVEGNTSWGFWESALTVNRYNNFTWGTGYLYTDAVRGLIGQYNENTASFSGWDPRDPDSEVPGGAAANIDKFSKARAIDFSAGAGTELFELPAGSVSAYVGAAIRKEHFMSDIDSLTKAGKIFGGSGGAGGTGERTAKAVYSELAVPVTEQLDVNIAGRYDHYSDFGGTFNPQLGLRYTPLPNLLVRASYGEGFRAPTLADLYRGPTQGWYTITNYPLCHDTAAEQITGCTRRDSIYVDIGGNDKLKAETSKTSNLGVVWDIHDNISLTADFWELKIDNIISQLSPGLIAYSQAKLWEAADAAGQPRPAISELFPNTAISFLPNGRLENMKITTTNRGFEEKRGIDVKLSGRLNTDIGEFKADLGLSHITRFKRSQSVATNIGELEMGINEIGRISYPSDRVNLTLNYNLGDHSLTYYSNYISAQKNKELNTDDNWVIDNRVGSLVTHNISYQLELPWQGKVSFGVNNLTDEDPRFDKWGGYSRSLYSIYGRTLYLGYTQSF
ncbi:hypothetical protein WG68_09625 [Arsukibacterium ikkense]|uniref:TonB-dependent receptor n=1 Tax=Arsukibacterium ikkense TaxID=336831 RepID=A0A0M2V4S1_9GAMM|nr:TonB-dependent receptor [Arsukibacterium ikkense]KKO45631.1 hypothetical protein WG68_09625 [Arsukibacterium ikkense]